MCPGNLQNQEHEEDLVLCNAQEFEGTTSKGIEIGMNIWTIFSITTHQNQSYRTAAIDGNKYISPKLSAMNFIELNQSN